MAHSVYSIQPRIVLAELLMTMRDSWQVARVLPNLRLSTSVGNRFAALCNFSDPRVAALEREDAASFEFLKRFTNEFGVRIHPTILLVSRELPHAVWSAEALVSFRDMFSVSVVPKARARLLHDDGQNEPIYSDYFEFYPWSVGKDREFVVAHTPAMWSGHLLKKFSGKSSPSLPMIEIQSNHIDFDHFHFISNIWYEYYIKRKKLKKGYSTLFRSLNMAYHAAAMPGNRDVTLYDLGRLIALWVSACEILVHPCNSNVNKKLIIEKMRNRCFLNKNLKARLYKRKISKKRQVSVDYIEWFVEKMYNLRNDYLHGNHVRVNDILHPKSSRSMFLYPAILYRLVLSSAFDLGVKPVSNGQIIQMIEDGSYQNYALRRYHEDLYEQGLLSFRTQRSSNSR